MSRDNRDSGRRKKTVFSKGTKIFIGFLCGVYPVLACQRCFRGNQDVQAGNASIQRLVPDRDTAGSPEYGVSCEDACSWPSAGIHLVYIQQNQKRDQRSRESREY